MNAGEVTIREYGESDFPAILDMESPGGGDLYCHAVFIRQIAVLFPGLFLIAEDRDGKIIGYTIGGLTSGEHRSGLVMRLFVSPDSRRCGTGRLLMRELSRRFASHCADSMVLTVSPSNDAALNMYLSLGFSKSDYISNYFGMGEDRIVMAAPLHHGRN